MGLYHLRLDPSGVTLLREIVGLSPRPNLGALFPLRAFRFDAQPGVLDSPIPDLTFYGLDRVPPTTRLFVTRSNGSARLTW